MKKKLLLLLCTIMTIGTITGCSSESSDFKTNDVPAVEVSIDGKNSDDTTGFTYLYDYGNGFRLYADDYTKIVYVLYYNHSGSGAKSTMSTSLSPWLSQNGKYCYIDTEDKTIKELDTDNVVKIDSNDKNKDETDNTDVSESDTNEDTSSSSEESGSSDLDKSITDKINQNGN